MRNQPTNMSEFKDGEGSQFMDDQAFTDDQSDGSYLIRVDAESRASGSRRKQKFGSMRGSMRGSVRSSVRSKSKKNGADNKERVQVISDFESEDESIGNYSEGEFKNINEEIDRMEEEALILKRQNNVYDICGLTEKDSK